MTFVKTRADTGQQGGPKAQTLQISHLLMTPLISNEAIIRIFEP